MSQSHRRRPYNKPHNGEIDVVNDGGNLLMLRKYKFKIQEPDNWY